MKKLAVRILLSFMLIINALPIFAAADARLTLPESPYEKAFAKSGDWYTEIISSDGLNVLAVAYQGEYRAETSLFTDSSAGIQFALKDKMVLKGIYLPYAKKQAEPVTVVLKDDQGNIYGPYKTEEMLPNEIVEMSMATNDKQNGAGVGSAQTSVDAVNYVFTPQTDIVLPAGKIIMTVSDRQGQAEGKPFLIKGILNEAYERFNSNVLTINVKNNSGKDQGKQKTGNEDFASGNLADYKYGIAEKAPERKPAVFVLKSESMVGEIVINMANEGKGAMPGTIAILDDKGTEVVSYQSAGGSLGKIPNGVWGTAPNIVLPAGKYTLAVSDPEAVSYDKSGMPEFFVTVLPPPPTRYDFTGTYYINLTAKKVSTLMGPVANDPNPFSLKNFEVTILDKGTSIELIAKYKGMPFSLGCPIVEEKKDKLVASFLLNADLSNLPGSQKIGAAGTITLIKPEKGNAILDIAGNGTYDRAATKEKGADHNIYSVKADGIMKTKELPGFVVTALGKTGSAGSIPGPDNTAQAAAGLLFPPLIGLVVMIVTESIQKAAQKPKKYSPEWYAEKYPGRTKEQLAWIMLADAMGNTDEPDAGDSESGSSGDSSGDGSGGESSDSSGENAGDSVEYGGTDNGTDDSLSDSSDEDIVDSGDSESTSDSYGEDTDEDGSEDSGGEIEDDTAQTEPEKEPDAETEGKKIDPDAGKSLEQIEAEKAHAQADSAKVALEVVENPAAGQETQAEPETMTVQTDWTGRTTTYVKDAQTGEWINPETGGVFDPETYEKVVKPSFEKDKAFIEGERDKQAREDTAFDKEMQELLAKQQAEKQVLEKEIYLEKLERKYGVTDRKGLEDIIAAEKARDQESADAWNKAATRYGYAEAGGKIVGVVADNAIDGLANVTGPAGRGIRAAYKVTKSIAGTMAEEGVSMTSFKAGTVKGGADAATDFIDSAKVKAVVTITGEVTGGAILKGTKGAKDGLVDGISKVVQGTIADKLGGEGFGKEAKIMALSNGNVRVAINTGEKWIGRTVNQNVANTFIYNKNMNQVTSSLVKTAGGLLDEFGIKPYGTEPFKDSYK